MTQAEKFFADALGYTAKEIEQMNKETPHMIEQTYRAIRGISALIAKN